MSDGVNTLELRASLLVLCGLDIVEGDVEEALATNLSTLRDDLGSGIDAAWDGVTRAVSGVHENFEALNGQVQAVSPRWRIGRMASVDRSILRLGAWHLLYAKSPAKSVINTLVDLAKEYGEKSTPAFVNGLLDQLCQDHDIVIR